MRDALSGDRSLAFLRTAATLVAIFDVVTLTLRHLSDAPLHRIWIARAGVMGALADSRALVIAAGVIAIAALSRFAALRGRIWPGVVALVAFRLAHELFGAASGLYHENYYHAGAFLAGWVGGAIVARGMGARGRTRAELLWSERISALAATGMLAGTWIDAGISKLRGAWLDGSGGDILRLMILRHVAPRHGQWRLPLEDWVVAHAGAADLLAHAALVIEVGAFVLVLGPRLRAVWGTLVLGLHLGIFAVSGIFFAEAILLCAFVAYPWVAIVDRLRGRPHDDTMPAWTPDPRAVRRSLAVIGGVALACAALPFSGITPRAQPVDGPEQQEVKPGPGVLPPATSGPRAVDRFGPLVKGGGLGAWHVAALTVEEERVVVDLADGKDPAITFELKRAAPGVPAGPFAAPGVAISYRKSPRSAEDCEAAGNALAAALVKEAPDLGASFTSWMKAASGS